MHSLLACLADASPLSPNIAETNGQETPLGVNASVPRGCGTSAQPVKCGAGASQTIRAHMMASAVGLFSESFEWELEGAAEPVRLTIHGRAVPPTVKVLFTDFQRLKALRNPMLDP